MRWWQSAFSSSSGSSSSSSSCSSSKVYSDDSLLASGGGIRYTIKSAFFFARKRRHARAKKLQNLTEHDGDDWRSHCSNDNLPSKYSSDRPPPQPLPLPELHLVLRHESDAVSNEPNVPLPSPSDAHLHHRTGEDSSTRKDGVASHGRYVIFYELVSFQLIWISRIGCMICFPYNSGFINIVNFSLWFYGLPHFFAIEVHHKEYSFFFLAWLWYYSFS